LSRLCLAGETTSVSPDAIERPRALRLCEKTTSDQVPTLRAGARAFRTELDDNAGPDRHTLVKGIKAGSIGDGESQMMQTDVSVSIERDCFTGRFDLPQRQDAMPIGHEYRWIIGPLADDAPSKAIAKELLRAHEVANS
jgi:hypothetical protein